MKLSPFAIRSQQFKRSIRGYDPDEVEAALNRIADEVEAEQAENLQLKKQLDSALEKIKQYRKIEKNLQNTLLNAQESSSKSKESIKKQTALMIKEAELKATQIVEKSKENANDLRDTILKLREEKKLLLAKIKAIVDTQTEILSYTRESEKPVVSEPEKKQDKPDSDIDIDDIVESIL